MRFGHPHRYIAVGLGMTTESVFSNKYKVFKNG